MAFRRPRSALLLFPLALLAAVAVPVGVRAQYPTEYDENIRALMSHPAVRTTLNVIEDTDDRTMAELVALTEIPVPPFQEENRIRELGPPPTVEIDIIGDRPSSTDANTPISLGVPAITTGGGGQAFGGRSLREWYRNEAGPIGIQRVLLNHARTGGRGAGYLSNRCCPYAGAES